jgi:predicted nucleotidyltransferase
MQKQEAIRLLREHADAIRALGATGLYLFGSTARGNARAGSDVDLFVDYDESGPFSLIELLPIKDYLEEILHHPADVTTRDSLHPMLRDRILAEAERVF